MSFDDSHDTYRPEHDPDEPMDAEPEVTEKVERTDTGFRLTVESTRGTGTRDQDKVKAELRTEKPATDRVQRELVSHVKSRMTALRAHQPDEDGEDDE